MKKNKPLNRLLSLALCLCMVLSLVPGIPIRVSAAADTKAYAPTRMENYLNDYNAIFGNGTPITIEAAPNGTRIWYMDGSTKKYVTNNKEDGEDLSEWYIFGGSENVDGMRGVNTSITMTGGRVRYIYAGQDYGHFTGTVDITITGGTVAETVVFTSRFGSNQTTTKGNLFDTTEVSISERFKPSSMIHKNGTVWEVTGSPFVPAGAEMTIASDESITISAGTTVTNNGTIVNNGTITVSGVLRNNGTFTDHGTTIRNAAYISTDSNEAPTVWADGRSVADVATDYADGKLYLYGVTGNIKATVGGTDYYGYQQKGSATELKVDPVVATDLTGIPEQIDANKAVTLNAVLSPTDTTMRQTVSYEVVDAGGTGAVVNGNTLTAYGDGTLKLRARVTDGYHTFTKDFSIYVNFTPVMGLQSAVPSQPGVHTLPGVVPSHASYQTVVWTVVSAGDTGATISGNKLTIKNTGTLKIKCVVDNGLAYGTPYTQEFTITVKELDYIDISQGSVTIAKKDDHTLTVTFAGFSGGSKEFAATDIIPITGTSTENTITVNSGSPIIQLQDVAIEKEKDIFTIQSGAFVDLILSGSNTLRVLENITRSAIHVVGGSSLSIRGEGSLYARGYADSAAIGSGFEETCGDITINSGNIQVEAWFGAGIGSGAYGNGGTIVINGGTIYATSQYGAAAIGGGEDGRFGQVIINGGNITAISTYKKWGGAGIGGGRKCKGGTVIINGGNIKASSASGQAIGNGYQGSGVTVQAGDGSSVSRATLTLNGAQAGAAVSAITGVEYGVNDVQTMDTDKLYFYLPSGKTVSSVTAGGTEYLCNRNLTYYTEHNFREATCAIGEVCRECGTITGEALGHSYDSEGNCTRCGMDEYGLHHIRTAEQLRGFASVVNAGEKTANAILEADIDLENVIWTTICETGLYYKGYGEDLGYAGIFDGNGHVIKNITVKSSSVMDASCGLFGTVSGTVKNLGVEGFTLVDGGKDMRTGAIVGQLITASGCVENCYVKNASILPGEHVTGGIAGCVYEATVANCYVVASNINGTKDRYGYLVGDTRGDNSSTDRPGTVKNCYTDNATIRSNNVGNVIDCTVKSTEQFASGEVTYLLNGSVANRNLVWFQTIGTDSTPRFTGAIVLYSEAKGYYNHAHTWTYTVEDTTIYASCENENGDCINPDAGSVTLYLPDSNLFTGDPIEAWMRNTLTTGDEVTVVYSGEKLVDGKPVYFGAYTASVTLGGQTVSLDYTVDCHHEQWSYSANEGGHLKYCACGYSQQEAHSYNDQAECICGNICSHTGGTATCTKLAICELCRLEYGTLVRDNHADNTNTKLTDNDDGTHSLICSACSEPISTDEHRGGTATCIQLPACEDCGAEYGYIDYYNHVGPYSAEFEWYPEEDDSCYVYAALCCDGCETYIDSNSDYAELIEEIAPIDCSKPGKYTWSYTATLNGEVYADSYTKVDYGDKHVGQFIDGFCSVCGSYEEAKWNEEDYVYEIHNAGQLYWYAQELNTNDSEIYAKLMKDIVIPETAPNWEPINATYVNFDGNFKTISGLKCIDTDAQYVGLFGNEGWWYNISNLHITDSYFEGGQYVGAVVASLGNGGIVTNCYVTNTTVKGDENGDVGALVGYLGSSTVENCYTDSDIHVGYWHSDYGYIINSYYLSEEETEDGGKTAAQFASGEVAYLLQSGIVGEDIYDEDWNVIDTIIPQIWGQTIGSQKYPVFGGQKVYAVTNCQGGVAYSNTNENGVHTYVDGTCSGCGATSVVQPTIALKYPTLSFKDEVLINIYYAIDDLQSVEEMGLITYAGQVDSWNIHNAEAVITGTRYYEKENLYIATTNGIPAKNMGDEVWFAVYAKLTDGSYVYSMLASYSPKMYADYMLGYDSVELDSLLVSMLNYGAAAQTYFVYNTDKLVNRDLTEAQKAMVSEYSSDMIAQLPSSIPAEKQGAFANNNGFSNKYPSVSFKGAFAINYYCKTTATPVEDVTLYYWDEAAYAANQVLTAENATGTVEMTLTSNGEYTASVTGIAARKVNSVVYVAFSYTDGNTDYSSGILAYSIGEYCRYYAGVTHEFTPMAKATAVYGFYAKEYFG